MDKTRFIENAEIWTEMDGDDDLEKRVNSYLTCHFLYSTDVSSDECLSEAKRVIEIIRKYDIDKTVDEALKI